MTKVTIPSLKLRLIAAAKLLEETFLHPLSTSRIIIDTEKNMVYVERGDEETNGTGHANRHD